MNNSELESILKEARMPERPNDFWQTFPGRIISGLASGRPPADRPETPFLPRWAWGVGLAACLLVSFAIARWNGQNEPRDVLQSMKLVGETLSLFPHRVRAIVEDEVGLRLVLSDDGDVPPSVPLYIRICDGQHCTSAVTFSGQEIQLAGRKITVLADIHGGIILEGHHFLWSNTERIYAGSHLTIEAKDLGALPM